MSEAPLTPILNVEALSFSYPRRHVFTGWSANFGAGITWLRGPNGCGKSTLLKLLAGALPPLLGRRLVLGIDADAQPLDYRREVFWCGPSGVPFDHLSITEYLGFIRGLYPRFDVEAVATHLRGFGLWPLRGKRLNTLSTGTQRKVALSAALAVGSRVVLIDEPLNALDEASLAWLREAFARCAADTACAWIIASHEPVTAPQAGVRLLELAAPDPAL